MNKNPLFLILSLSTVLFFIVSCFSESTKDIIVKSPEDFDDIPSWILYLSELEQDEPENFFVKKSLARAYIVSNDWDKAELYINQAEKRMPGDAEVEDQYEVFAYKAQILFRNESYDESLRYIEQAIDVIPADPMLLELTKANILSTRQEDGALEIYDSLWSASSNNFGKKDVELYFSALTQNGNWEKALSVLTEYFNQTGYQSGLGLHFSIVYENLGKMPESILSIFVELLYQRDYGNITEQSIQLALDAVKEKMKIENEDYITALISISNYMYDDASILLETSLYSDETVFYDYIKSQIMLYRNPANKAVLQEYIDIEWKYRSLPSYYYILWTSMKRGGENYSLNRVQGVLEKTIALNPNTSISTESRMELGRLMGLNTDERSKILVGPEIDDLAYRYASTGNVQVLDPCLDMLELQNNEYTDAVVNMFIQLKELDNDIVTYLTAYEPESSLAKIRIENIINY